MAETSISLCVGTMGVKFGRRQSPACRVGLVNVVGGCVDRSFVSSSLVSEKAALSTHRGATRAGVKLCFAARYASFTISTMIKTGEANDTATLAANSFIGRVAASSAHCRGCRRRA
jgi:hypothetical protein